MGFRILDERAFSVTRELYPTSRDRRDLHRKTRTTKTSFLKRKKKLKKETVKTAAKTKTKPQKTANIEGHTLETKMTLGHLQKSLEVKASLITPAKDLGNQVVSRRYPLHL